MYLGLFCLWARTHPAYLGGYEPNYICARARVCVCVCVTGYNYVCHVFEILNLLTINPREKQIHDKPPAPAILVKA